MHVSWAVLCIHACLGGRRGGGEGEGYYPVHLCRCAFRNVYETVCRLFVSIRAYVCVCLFVCIRMVVCESICGRVCVLLKLVCGGNPSVFHVGLFHHARACEYVFECVCVCVRVRVRVRARVCEAEWR